MRFLLIISFIAFSLKTNAITQKEALEQVNGMDEKEHVERSLKTILYLSFLNIYEDNEQDNILPVELYLDYDIKTFEDKRDSVFGCNSIDIPDKDKTCIGVFEYESSLHHELYTKGFLDYDRFVKYNFRKPEEKERKLACKKALGYEFIDQNCNSSGSYIYVKTKIEIITLEKDFAVLKVINIQDPAKSYSDLKNPNKYWGLFILKKQNGIWKIDGRQCGGKEECSYHYKATNH